MRVSLIDAEFLDFHRFDEKKKNQQFCCRFFNFNRGSLDCGWYIIIYFGLVELLLLFRV